MDMTVKIGNREVGDTCPCFIIAEIGINHNGSLELVKELIEVAKAAGCDAVRNGLRNSVLLPPNETCFARLRGESSPIWNTRKK